MSARWRLTLSYAGFLLLAGAGQAALLVYILRFVPEGNIVNGVDFVPNRSDLLDALWPRIAMVLGALVLVGLVGGWFLAGRMLRPLDRINAVARQVAAGTLDERVRLTGPHDEFRELAETFDDMLDRLQRSFDEQRRFAANAAHELRTPFTVTRSLLEVARADLQGQDLARLVDRLDETTRRGADVLEALLALSTLDQGIVPNRAPVDLAETAADVIEELRPLAASAGVTVRPELGEGDIDGSPTLVRQLVTNIVANGIRHNLPAAGWVTVSTATADDGAVSVTVENSGPVVPPELVERLTEPFVRAVDRVSSRGPGPASGQEGSGLGLALVSRVSQVHGAELTITAPPTGGLVVRVRFPASG